MLKSMEYKHVSIMFGNINAQNVHAHLSYAEESLQSSVNVG
jgi:hypothetical protein